MRTKRPKNLKQGAILVLGLSFVSRFVLIPSRYEVLRFYELTSHAGPEASDGNRGL